ncbi:hypothetical protein EB796_003078 [Bugula neritina]|uniref:Uncharacterized protein n=1 Tax=Bugula neritina TaxID=10212 RepID=A0A7J7KIU1_BUGNE|nr:hypothetical protein EB796_003078 [Bugula neritina]
MFYYILLCWADHWKREDNSSFMPIHPSVFRNFHQFTLYDSVFISFMKSLQYLSYDITLYYQCNCLYLYKDY